MASPRLAQCWRSLCVIAVGTTSVCCGSEDVVATRRPRAVTRPIVFNDNGAWSWFEDERAVVDVERATLLIATVANRDGDDGAARHGDIEVVAYRPRHRARPPGRPPPRLRG